MDTQKTLLRIFILLSACAIFIVGCQPKAETTPASLDQNPVSTTNPSSNGNLVTINADISLDPALTQDPDSLRICQNIYDGIIRLDTAGVAQPGLASSWIVSDDQLDYIFTLRTGTKFSDGSPITADNIVDNFNRWFDPTNPLHKNDKFVTWEKIFLGFNGEKDDNDRPKSPIDGIQKVDVNTIIIHLNRPVPTLISDLANPAFSILDPVSLVKGDYGKRDSNIITSGPFIISSWTDSELTLSPNPNYWGTQPSANLNFTIK